jgi:uncharacterized repeat protein (TIGR01451 family)
MLSAGLAFSADRTWTGAGGNADWSTPGNWVGSVVPTTGDRAIFPAGPSNKNVVLSAPVSIDAIDFRDCGYTVSSGSAPLTLESATPVSSDCSASPGNELNPSLLTLNASLPQVTVRATGGPPVGRDLLRLGVGSNTVQVGQGPLRFDIQQLTTGTIPEVRSNFSVTSGGVEINGNGVVIPGAATSFAGVMRCLGGVLRVTNASALGANGSLAARTEVHSGCALELAATVANETLQLRHNVLATPPVVRGVTNVSWSGPIEILGTVAVADRQAQFAFASPVTLSLSGTFSGDGALAVAGPELGSLRLQTAATHTGDTLIEAPAALVIEDLSDVLPDTTVLRLNGGKFEYRTIALSGTDTIAGIEGSIGSEILLEGYKGLRLNDTANRTYAGKISGIGFVEKLGGGILTLPGMIGVSNLTINNGAVALNNPSNVGSVQVQASGALHTGIVGGTGALSSGTSTTAAIRPGGPTAGGTLQVNGPLNVAGGVTLEFDFPGGSRGGSADRIVLPNPTDTVALGGASLSVVFDAPLNPGAVAMVIENAGVDAITGTFAGVADDSIQNFSGDNYRVDYQGGDGNDFTISRPELLSFVNPASLPDGVVGIAYGQSLRALGGFPGYTFNVTSGALPSGLSLLPSGVFSGAPIGSGLFTFDVQATDLAGDTVTRNFTLRVLTGSAVWDGGGADDFWATAQNWQGDVAPTPGQTLIFPAGAPRPTSINNFPAGTVFAGIKMAHGQSITGNAISLSSNLPIEVRPTASNFSSIGASLTFQASNATVQAFANYAGPSGQFALTAGGSTVSFSGTLVLSVGNQNVGTEYFIAASNLSGANIEMNSGGLPDPGRVDLVGNSSFTGPALIDGGVEVLLRTSQGLGTGDNSSATGTQIRNGNLILAPPSTPFTVANERVFINDDGAGVPAKLAFQGGAAFDAIWSGSVVTSGTGTARIEVFSGQLFRISGDISGNSPLFLGGTSGTTIEFTNSGNSFTGDLFLGPDTTLAVGSMSLPTSTDLSMANTATFRTQGTSQTLTSLNGGGLVNMSPGGELTLNIAGSSSYTGQFQLAGGTLRKIGSGSFQYSGFLASSGTCILGSGDLLVEGVLGCQLRIDNGRLSGTGSVGSIINDSSTSSGSIELGENIFSAAADVDLGSAIQYLPLLGSPGSRILLNGTLNLSGAVLAPVTTAPISPSQSFVIMENAAFNIVTGTFAGAPEGSIVVSAPLPQTFRVSYAGGNGNDVTLTRVVVPQITTLGAPPATVGVPYNAFIQTVDGTPPYSYSVVSGSLPPGIALSDDGTFGILSGTPSGNGTFNFVVEVTDNNSETDTQLFEFVVNGGGGSVFTWDGGSSTDSNWTTAANWVGDIAPVGNMGEALEFPDSAARKTNINDFPADTLFDSLTVSARDYVITGNGLELDGLQPLVTVAPATLGADSRIDIDLGFPGSSDFLAITTGNGTRNKLLLNTGTFTDVGLGTDAVLAMTNGSGTAQSGMHFGRIRQKGPINITVQSGFYRIDDSNHTGSITVQGGNLELGSAAAVGSSNGLAATGIEVNSSGQLILASGFVSPALERLALASGTLASNAAVEWRGDIVISGSADFAVFSASTLLSLPGAITGTGNIGVNGDPLGVVRFQNPSNAWVGNFTCSVTCELSADEVIPNTAVVSVGVANRSSLGGFATLRLSSAVETVAQLNVDEVLEPGFAVINTGGFNMNSGSRLRARWTGNTPGVNQSQIVVTGTVNLAASAMLDPINATLSTGSLVKLIDNDLSDPISGVFQGMAENAAVALLGSNYRVRYTAIDGNDLVFFRLDPLDITTNSLPDGQELVPYDQTVVATGGFLTGSWSATGLPPGLSIASGTGRITGNPSMAGTFNASITVTDSLPAPASTDTQIIAITINAGGGGTFVWDGGGADDRWSTAQNWAGDVAPTPGIGDRLVFPLGAARKSNTNDFPNGSIFDSLEMSTSDYVIAGNSVRLSGNPGLVANAPLTVGADSTLDLEMTLDGNQLLGITVGDGPRNTLRVNSISSTNRVIVNSNMTMESLNQSAGTGLTGMRIDRLQFAGGSEIAINGVYSIGASNHTGKIQVLGGAFIALSPAAFGSGDGTIATGVEVNTDGQLALSAAGVIAPATERLYLHDTRPGQPPGLVAFGAGQWNGPIELAGASHRFASLSSQLLRISGAITGTSSTVAFEGSPSNGEIRLENSANAFSGNILSTGDLTLSTQIAEVIPNTASLDVGTGVVLRLGGNETLSAIDIAGTLAPHEFILTATDIDFIAGSTLRPNWNGALPGSNQAQLVATNSVDLSANPILDAPLASLSDGTTIRLIDNQSANPTLGHFTGVTENQDAILNGGRYRLRYGAGTGNDVELIRYELLAISAPATLPNGTLGVSYTQAITATGGIAPYSWSATGLPAGLSIDPGTGVISGSPSASGPFSVTVDVIDNFPSPSNNQQRVYGLTISNSEPTTASVVSVAPANFVLFPASFTPTARVVGTATRPSGTLQLRADEAFSKATITCNASTINGPGPLDLDGSCALTPTTPGIWQVSASFTGGPGYLNSFTPSVDYTVRATSSFGAITQSATTTVVGEPFTVTINLSGNGIAPFGMVNVQPLPVGNFASCNLAPTGGNNSACSVTIISPAAVAKLLNVSYLGSGGPVPVFAPFNAPTQGHNTEKAQSISAITSSGPNPALQNQPITVNYRVAIQAPGAPTALSPIDGEVRVSDGTTQCTGTLTQNGAFATGSCQLSIATLGARSLRATYLGNQAFLPSVSPVFTQNVVAAGTGPDLAVALGNGSNSLIGGNTVKYVLRVRNFGPVAATNASVTMPVPSGASNMSWTCTPIPPSSCNGTGSGAISQLVSLAQPGAEPSEVRFDITLTLPSNEGAFTASAQVAAPSGQSDPNLSNNAVVDTDFIGLFADGFEDVNPNE